jgi:hypothetical protein
MTLTNKIAMFFMAFALVGFFNTAEANRIKELRKQRKELHSLVKGGKKVSYELGEDENGEWVRLFITGKIINKVGDFKLDVSEKGIYSNVGVVTVGDHKELQLQIYTSDLEGFTPGQDLQTSPGREFPRFFGTRHQTLWGVPFKQNKYHMYLDAGTGIFGVYANIDGVGNLINKVNDFKNKIPVIQDIIPNINSLPVPLKIKKKKVITIYALAHDANNERGGLVLLVDHYKLVELIKKEKK